MEQTKGLSCQIPESLHARVTAERVAANQSLSEYITGLLTNYYENGGKKVTQKEFVIGLIEDALERWEQETADADPGAPTDTLDPIDEPADSAPSWEAEETEGGAKNVAK